MLGTVQATGYYLSHWWLSIQKQIFVEIIPIAITIFRMIIGWYLSVGLQNGVIIKTTLLLNNIRFLSNRLYWVIMIRHIANCRFDASLLYLQWWWNNIYHVCAFDFANRFGDNTALCRTINSIQPNEYNVKIRSRLCLSNMGTETLVLIENLFKDKMCWDNYFRINRRKITQKQPLHIHMYIYIYTISPKPSMNYLSYIIDKYHFKQWNNAFWPLPYGTNICIGDPCN